MRPDDVRTLLDWKRRVFALYADVRAAPDRAAAWGRWRAARDELFATHPQSPLPRDARASFAGLDYFDYDPAARVCADVAPADPVTYDIATSTDSAYSFTRVGSARFELSGRALELELYWLEGYGGGLFVPFRDATSGAETYGGGRYLLDTVKGADLGHDGDALVLDFNFAYNPSCAYDPRWTCPLAPPPNRLDVAVRCGERTPRP
ncbi:MAG TPA: DUF1684 domain-containing protein [Actinomycetota bacterium]|nr:DUF1684 domain-containing protein [Actinomycetota bacterium]